jgi:rhodanese-related sulfurtransferase
MKHISISEFKNVLAADAENPAIDFINVCTPGEYAAAHIPGVRSMPLDTLTAHVGELKDKKMVYVHCRSGARSQMAIQTLQSLGVTAELVNVEGGIMAWEGAGHPTKSV